MQSLSSNSRINTNQSSMITNSIVEEASENSIRISTEDSSLYLSHSNLIGTEFQNKPLHEYSIATTYPAVEEKLKRTIYSTKSYNNKIIEIENEIPFDWKFPNNPTYNDISNRIKEDFKDDNPRMNHVIYCEYFKFQCIKFIDNNASFKDQLLLVLVDAKKIRQDSPLYETKQYIIEKIRSFFHLKDCREKKQNHKLQDNILIFQPKLKKQNLHDADKMLSTNNLRNRKPNSKKKKWLIYKEEWQFSDNPSFEDIKNRITEDFFQENNRIKDENYLRTLKHHIVRFIGKNPNHKQKLFKLLKNGQKSNISSSLYKTKKNVIHHLRLAINAKNYRTRKKENDNIEKNNLCRIACLEEDKTQTKETAEIKNHDTNEAFYRRKITSMELLICDEWKFSSELTYQDMKNKIEEEFTQDHERLRFQEYRNYFEYKFLYFLEKNITLKDELVELLPKRINSHLNSELGRYKREIIAYIKKAISAKKRYIKKKNSIKSLARNNHHLSSTSSLSLSEKDNKILQQNNVDSSESNNFLVNISKAKEGFITAYNIPKQFEQESASHEELENIEEFQDFLNEDGSQSSIEHIPEYNLQAHELRSMGMEYCSESISIDSTLFGDTFLENTLFLNENE